MKKLLSALLILALTLALLSATAFAAGNPELSKYSDAEIKQMYEAFRDDDSSISTTSQASLITLACLKQEFYSGGLAKISPYPGCFLLAIFHPMTTLPAPWLQIHFSLLFLKLGSISLLSWQTPFVVVS